MILGCGFDGSTHQLKQEVVIRSASQRPLEIDLLIGEKAPPESAFGSESQPIAFGTEVVAERPYQPYLSRPFAGSEP